MADILEPGDIVIGEYIDYHNWETVYELIDPDGNVIIIVDYIRLGIY
jgi:hypothetical protein